MGKTISLLQDKPQCLSFVSFGPLIKYLKHNRQENNYSRESNRSIDDFIVTFGASAENAPIIQTPADVKLLDEILNITFTESDFGTNFYAITAPNSYNIIYASERYQNTFSYGNTITESAAFFQIDLEIAYKLILQKYYGLSLITNNTFIHEVKEPISGLQKFFEMELVADFLEITLTGSLPELDTSDLVKSFSEIKCNNLLEEKLPLDLFSIKGFTMIKVRDVSARESLSLIKNTLLSMPYFGDHKSSENLKKQVQHLLELPDASVCLTSLIKENTRRTGLNEIVSENLSVHPVSFTHDSPLWQQLKNLFNKQASLLISNLTKASLHQFPFLQTYFEKDVKSLVLFPLKHNEELVGILSILIKNEDKILNHHLSKIEPLIPLLVVALDKQSDKMDDEIDRVIKEQFTAVQSSVNWKFTEAARKYIIQTNKGHDSEIENIVFENVFPLYGSIDVRNSSIERSTAIQKDLLEQLNMAAEIIGKSKREIYLFSLEETSYRIDKYRSIASLVLFPGDELAIQNFLDDEINALFNHLKKVVPAVSNDIDNYFYLLNANTNKISKQCTAFEKSITLINNELVKFITHEQAKVQEIYAHYFEYFVTDGVDFNIYIGQSITPGKPFDYFYLKNLKLWQLTTLVKAAQKIRNLRATIPVSLDTTQLILAHSKPLSISFRVAERKFDVDGAYNIHYEIIKKRIDKVKIMGSCERLTQPGKIAIVFAHDKEAQEYTSYINYLQQQGLLEETIEYFDLEELPGVRGLKALRVSIIMDAMEECPSLNMEQLLQRVG